jgi:hypothetical protein
MPEVIPNLEEINRRLANLRIDEDEDEWLNLVIGEQKDNYFKHIVMVILLTF